MVNEGFPNDAGPPQMKTAGDTEAVNLAAAVLNGGEDELPDVPDPAGDEIVELPGGLVVATDAGPKVVREVQIREMTGADEEKLAKASASRNQFHYFNTMLELLVVRIGDQDRKDYPKLLKSLLIGDREAIVLAIRALTYGTEFEVFAWDGCPYCDEISDLSMDLSDPEVVPYKRLDDPLSDGEFDVQLRKGQKAHVRLLTGEDQEAIAKRNEGTSFTWAERNSLVLQRVVSHVYDANGNARLVAAAPSLVVNLGVADRKKILEELVKRAPGPSYTAIKFLHPPCGKEVTLALGLADLFQG